MSNIVAFIIGVFVGCILGLMTIALLLTSDKS